MLSLGRLVHKKGIEYLLLALPEILKSCPTVCCVIAGAGPEQTALQALAHKLQVEPHVVFVGNVDWDDVPVLYALCDLFVVPSLHDEDGNVDGLPTTILEAMAAGKPVVASHLGGIDLVVSHGETGLLVEEKNVEQLAAAVITLLTKPAVARQFGNAAQHACAGN